MSVLALLSLVWAIGGIVMIVVTHSFSATDEFKACMRTSSPPPFARMALVVFFTWPLLAYAWIFGERSGL